MKSRTAGIAAGILFGIALLALCDEVWIFADGGGLYLNNERVGAADLVTEDRVIDGQVFVLRAGKKNYFVLKFA